MVFILTYSRIPALCPIGAFDRGITNLQSRTNEAMMMVHTCIVRNLGVHNSACQDCKKYHPPASIEAVNQIRSGLPPQPTTKNTGKWPPVSTHTSLSKHSLTSSVMSYQSAGEHTISRATHPCSSLHHTSATTQTMMRLASDRKNRYQIERGTSEIQKNVASQPRRRACGKKYHLFRIQSWPLASTKIY